MYERFLLPRCEIAYEHVDLLNEEEFALIRRNGIGASDTSAILGAMDKFRTADDVLANKLEPTYTDDERAISQKIAVRKGRDLEPLILNKATQHFKASIWKPTSMYRLKEFPHLTINYDGLMLDKDEDVLIPVECKYVTIYGDKYYNFKDPQEAARVTTGKALDRLNELAAWHGIPGYYMLQVHQQLMGTGSKYAYLAAFREKDWTLYIFKIPRYEWIINWITTETYAFQNRVKRIKENHI